MKAFLAVGNTSPQKLSFAYSSALVCIASIFSNSNLEETYTTYSVYIVKEEDNLQSILSKYNVTEEELGKYNDLTNIKLKDKLIIPYIDESN